MTMVDPCVAHALRHLTPPARQRLDGFIHNASGASRSARNGYRAGRSEMPDLLGVEGLEARARRGTAVLTVVFEGGLRWEEQRLEAAMQIPDTLLSAMRGRRLTDIVAHPMLGDAVVSSARRSEGRIVVETRRRPLEDVADIASHGAVRPLEIIETLRALGVERVCKVGANLIESLKAPARQAMLDRLCDTGAADLTDLLPWLPAGMESVRVLVHDGTLTCRAGLTIGGFTTGNLSIHGTSRSRSRLLGGWTFSAYKTIGRGYHARRPREPMMGLDEFARRIHK